MYGWRMNVGVLDLLPLIALLLIAPILLGWSAAFILARKGRHVDALVAFVFFGFVGWFIVFWLPKSDYWQQFYVQFLLGSFALAAGLLVYAMFVARKDRESAVNQQLEVMERSLRQLQREKSELQEAAEQICPRCQAKCPSDMKECWKCLHVFDDGSDTVVGAVIPVNVRHSQNASLTVKVRCKACNKKFSGLEKYVKAIEKCPKCGKDPFVYEELSVFSE